MWDSDEEEDLRYLSSGQHIQLDFAQGPSRRSCITKMYNMAAGVTEQSM